MSSVVADILVGIKAIIVSELGAEYKELPFTLDVAKNRFAGGTKGYAAWMGLGPTQTAGNNGFITVDHTFEVTLTDTYGSSQTGDAAQRVQALALFNRMEAVYVRIVAEKAGVPSRVMSAERLAIQPPEFLDSNVAVLRASFDIKYRTAR
jgi:hypothetical protein